jgi:hypothetical protein
MGAGIPVLGSAGVCDLANKEVGIIEMVEIYESTKKLLEYVQISLCGTFKTVKFLVVCRYVLLILFICSG